jgi:branched-chain amino acid transport system ATP-binding protein
MLRVEDLWVTVGGSDVLRGVCLEVPKGAVVAVVGRNGAGKTTLLGTVMGQLVPRSGRVVLDGRDVTGWAPHLIARLGVGYSPEDCGAFAGLTVEENLRFGTWAQPGRPPVDDGMEAAWALFPALRRYRRRRGDELSGGERRMLSIARVVASAPDLLLLDEPFEGLAPPLVPVVAEGIAALAGEDRSVLIAVSNVDHVPKEAGVVHVLERGEMVRSGPLGQTTVGRDGDWGEQGPARRRGNRWVGALRRLQHRQEVP